MSLVFGIDDDDDDDKKPTEENSQCLMIIIFIGPFFHPIQFVLFAK